jgi:hypothetical protein
MNVWTVVKISTFCVSVNVKLYLYFNLKDNPGCACGLEYENVFHFFLECPINEHIRNTLFLIL